MGKQSTKVLRRKVLKLIERLPDRFSNKFDENKKVLKELGLFDYSKKERNIIAGMITREISKRAGTQL